MFFLSSQQLSPSPVASGTARILMDHHLHSWWLFYSGHLSPQHPHGSWFCFAPQNLNISFWRSREPFWDHPSPEGATRSSGDSLKERRALLYPMWCLLWIVTVSHFSLRDRAVWPVLAAAIIQKSSKNHSKIQHLAGIPCAAGSRTKAALETLSPCLREPQPWLSDSMWKI